MLADQREEAQRTQESVQGHLNAMAVRLGELQAQMLRLDGLGERLAKIAGLKPQELPSMLQPGAAPGGAARRRRCRRAISRSTSSARCSTQLTRAGRRSAPTSSACSRRCWSQDSANRKFLPTLQPIDDGWYSSNFGYRIDPFTGEQTFHEGIDFPADVGTPIVAAASGKVVFAEMHPAVW